jgi:hypothetical protein
LVVFYFYIDGKRNYAASGRIDILFFVGGMDFLSAQMGERIWGNRKKGSVLFCVEAELSASPAKILLIRDCRQLCFGRKKV